MIQITNNMGRKLHVETVCSRNAVIIEIRTEQYSDKSINVYISMDDVRALACVANSSPDNAEVARMLNMTLRLLGAHTAELVDLPDIPPSAPQLPDIPPGWVG